MRIKVELCENRNTQHAVCISEDIVQRLSIPDKVTLKCGLHAKEMPVIPIKADQPAIKFSKHTFHSLHLPEESFTIRISMTNRETITLCPVVAVLTEIRTCNKSPYPLFGSITSFCEELAKYCQQIGFFFYVSSLAYFSDTEIKGYVWQNGTWTLCKVPYPDVVHNRLHSRKTEQTEKFKHFVNLLEKHDTPYFNAQFLNKWAMFTLLSGFAHLQPYIPETYLLRKKEDLMNALSTHGSVFLKPVHGSQGKHIFRIIQDSHSYKLDHTTFTQPYEKEHPTFHSLFESLYTQFKKQGFIIQRALSLQTYKGCPFDFRILCHRVKQTEWKITSIVARVSPKDSFVSNLARGGELMDIRTILQEIYDYPTSKEIIKLLKELALDICYCVTVSTNGLFAELGIDLAIDTDDRPWIIEVNTKPSKQHDSNNETSFRPSTKAILRYCAHLTGHLIEEV